MFYALKLSMSERLHGMLLKQIVENVGEIWQVVVLSTEINQLPTLSSHVLEGLV